MHVFSGVSPCVYCSCPSALLPVAITFSQRRKAILAIRIFRCCALRTRGASATASLKRNVRYDVSTFAIEWTMYSSSSSSLQAGYHPFCLPESLHAHLLILPSCDILNLADVADVFVANSIPYSVARCVLKSSNKVFSIITIANYFVYVRELFGDRRTIAHASQEADNSIFRRDSSCACHNDVLQILIRTLNAIALKWIGNFISLDLQRRAFVEWNKVI